MASTTDTGAGTNNNFNTTSPTVTVAPITYSSPNAGRLRLFNSDGTLYAINYNGGITASTAYSDGGAITISTIDRWVSLAYPATTKTVTVTANVTQSGGTACSASQVLFLNAAGTILKAASACGTYGTPVSFTFTDAAGTNTAIYVAFSRITDTSGGLRLWDFKLTY